MATRRHWLVGTALALSAGGLLAVVMRSRTGSMSDLPDEFCIVAPLVPHDPATGLSLLAARPVPDDARCPVCGMFAARYPRWAAQGIFDDGATQFFDSPAHLFLYLQRLDRYQRGRRAEDLLAFYVADHRSGKWLPLEQAVFVHGSRARGPMRTEDLPAFADTEAAQVFIADAGGAAARSAELRLALPAALRAQAPHRH